MSYSIVIIEGRVGKDPELKATTNGTQVANFSIASDFGYGKNAGTNWDNCVAFGEIATFASKHIKKGSAIRVIGERTSRKWTGKDGQEKTSNEVVVWKISFAEKSSGEGRSSSAPAARTQAAPAARAEAAPVARATTDLLADTEITSEDIPW
jgi:single-strand DNA-binding protein